MEVKHFTIAYHFIFRHVRTEYGQVWLNRLHDVAPGKQRFKFLIDVSPGRAEKLLNDIIMAGVFPIAGWQSSRIEKQIFHMVHHIPRAVDIISAGIVSVIPVPDLICMAGKSGILQEFVHVILHKPEILVQP